MISNMTKTEMIKTIQEKIQNEYVKRKNGILSVGEYLELKQLLKEIETRVRANERTFRI